jgi:hypothetical protein
MTSWPRREFILAVLGACGTAPLFDAPALQAQAAEAQLPARARIAAARYLGAAAPARVLGEAFMASLTLDVTVENVGEVARDTLVAIQAARTPAAAVKVLQQAVRDDFREGRTVHLHGWVLSRTELELCALSLLAGESGDAALPNVETGVK